MSQENQPPACSEAIPTGAGPVWFPLNYLFIEALYRYSRYFDRGAESRAPGRLGNHCTLAQVAQDLSRRLVSLFLPGPDGHRPVHGDNHLLQEDPAMAGPVWFHEYFHGDTGAGLGASHQTGWTRAGGPLIAKRALPIDQR